jgi:protein-disulfide isomerase
MEEEKKVMEVKEEESIQEIKVEETLEDKEKKIKNLVSVVILLAGLFVGSLFVDVIQLVRGGGFSQHSLAITDVFSSAGKTWVAYTQPIVKLQVINDETCGDPCKPDEVLLGLKEALPTMLSQKVDANSEAGKKLIIQFGIKTLPAFVFSKEIEQTDLFAKAEPFLEKQGNFYAIKGAEAGFPVGKYITIPDVASNDIKIGQDDAKVKVILFTDFQCPFCKQVHETVITQMLKEYGDKVQLVFKNYPLPIHSLALPAALAGECANAQGKFAPFADKIFSTQAVWGKLKDASGTFKTYAAQLGLKTAEFNKCLDSKQFQTQVDSTLAEGQKFGIQGTPAMFINDQFQNGMVKYEDLKSIIDRELAK